jgi:hypothetical protein
MLSPNSRVFITVVGSQLAVMPFFMIGFINACGVIQMLFINTIEILFLMYSMGILMATAIQYKRSSLLKLSMLKFGKYGGKTVALFILAAEFTGFTASVSLNNKIFESFLLPRIAIIGIDIACACYALYVSKRLKNVAHFLVISSIVILSLTCLIGILIPMPQTNKIQWFSEPIKEEVFTYDIEQKICPYFDVVIFGGISFMMNITILTYFYVYSGEESVNNSNGIDDIKLNSDDAFYEVDKEATMFKAKTLQRVVAMTSIIALFISVFVASMIATRIEFHYSSARIVDYLINVSSVNGKFITIILMIHVISIIPTHIAVMKSVEIHNLIIVGVLMISIWIANTFDNELLMYKIIGAPVFVFMIYVLPVSLNNENKFSTTNFILTTGLILGVVFCLIY